MEYGLISAEELEERIYEKEFETKRTKKKIRNTIKRESVKNVKERGFKQKGGQKC